MKIVDKGEKIGIVVGCSIVVSILIIVFFIPMVFFNNENCGSTYYIDILPDKVVERLEIQVNAIPEIDLENYGFFNEVGKDPYGRISDQDELKSFRKTLIELYHQNESEIPFGIFKYNDNYYQLRESTC